MSELDNGGQQSGVVYANHHQIVLGASGADNLDVRDDGRLLQIGPGFLNILTGIAYGPVEVTLRLLGTAPPDGFLGDSEAVEEADITARKPIQLTTLDGTPADGFRPLPAGRYRVRVHARGRDTHWDLDVAEPTESYAIDLWPTDRRRKPRTLRMADTAHVPVERPQPDFDYVWIFDSDGSPTKVEPYSPEAHAARQNLYDWHGDPPPPPLDTNLDAITVAGMDRRLFDRLLAATPEAHTAIARWAALQAVEFSGLNEVEWLAPLITALRNREPAPPEPDTRGFALQNRFDADPTAPHTIVSGLPGEFGAYQQHKALGVLLGAFSAANSLEADLAMFRSAAYVYGMQYPQLVAAAHAFLDQHR